MANPELDSRKGLQNTKREQIRPDQTDQMFEKRIEVSEIPLGSETDHNLNITQTLN